MARGGIVLVCFRLLMLAVIVVMGCGVVLVLAVHNSCTLILANFYSLWVPISNWVVVPCLLGVCFGLFLSRFKVWDPGKVWMPGLVGSIVLVFQDNDFIVGGALLKFNLSHILDLSIFNFLFKNKHNQLCKFGL